ncbi:MAG: oligosaccharide flippase family protein, partial [Bacteroidota bacterium]
MIEKILRLGKEAAIYGLSSIVGRFVNFLLVPLYTNFLLPSEYGVIATLYSYIAFAFILYGLGMEPAYMRFVSSMERNDRKETFTVPFVTLVAGSLILTSALHLFSGPLTALGGFAPENESLLRYAAWILFSDALAIIPFASLRMEHRAFRFAGFRILNILLTVVLNVVFLVAFGMKAEGVLLANLLASAITFGVLLRDILPLLTRKFGKPLFLDLLRFGLPYIPAGLASVAMQVIDRPILKALTDDATVGIYQANYRLGIFMMLVVGMFDYAWRPFFLDHAREP